MITREFLELLLEYVMCLSKAVDGVAIPHFTHCLHYLHSGGASSHLYGTNLNYNVIFDSCYKMRFSGFSSFATIR